MDVCEGLEALTRHQAVVAHVVVLLGGEVFANPCGFLLLHAQAGLHERHDSVVVVIVVLGQEALEDIFLRVLRVARRRGNSLLLPCARLLARVVLWLMVRCECAVAIVAGTLEPSGADAAAAAARLTAWFVALSNANIFFLSKERTPRAAEQVLR